MRWKAFLGYATILFSFATGNAGIAFSAEDSKPQEQGQSVELQKADFGNVEEIDDAFDVPDAWAYVADVPSVAPKPLARPISIQLPMVVNGLAFSGDASGIGGALETQRVSDGRSVSVETWLLHRFKLSNGQMARPTKLYSQSKDNAPNFELQTPDPDRLQLRPGALLSIGADGKTAVIKTSDTNRLDVWSLRGTGKHLIAWKPYADKNFPGGYVHWAAVLADDTVLTLDTEGSLICWKIPECKAIYRREVGKMTTFDCIQGLGIHHRPGLSPNHRHLAIWSGKSLLLLDAKTGKTMGVLGGVNSPGFIQPSFHQDGTRLACTEAESFTQVLVVYDLKTGAEINRFPLPNSAWPKAANSDAHFGGFTWVDEPYGVVGGKLMVDLGAGRAIWKFELPDPNIVFDPPLFNKSGPDFWGFISGERQKSLQSMKLPHADALQYAKSAPEAFVAGPGSNISIDLRTQAPQDVKEAMQKGLEQRVAALGLKVAKDQRVVLQIETEIRNADREALVVSSRGLGLPVGQGNRVNLQAIVVHAHYLVDGVPAWSNAIDYLPAGNESWKDDPNKSDQEELLEQQWDRIKQYSGRLLFERIPGYVIDPKAEAKFPAGPYPK